ncbi:uncharacterized protein LOC123988944 [Osmia bicornis bicornis]|uniref:uncharacterized protein LOC123988944 n=1 Tax=Osmia bicornis bicornis TaxID=1437191 RepID=UPI001EAF78C3|nr:uncharacterized protein LOC123988944 [Osmia bicornis bicornis]
MAALAAAAATDPAAGFAVAAAAAAAAATVAATTTASAAATTGGGGYQFNERLKSRSSTDAQTALPAGANEVKKTYKLPRIELIKFNGEIREWLPFWSRFKKIHEDADMDREDKFQYLIQATVPGSRASELVTSYPPTGENYEKVIDSLKNRFGREDVRELLQLVLQNAISPTRNMQLSTLYDKIESYLRALESLGVTTDKCAALLFPLVESSLPEELLRAWQRSNAVQYTLAPRADNTSTQSQDRLTRLIKFLEAKVQNELRITMAVKGFDLKVSDNSEANRQRKPRTHHDHKEVPSAAGLFATKVRENLCIFCGGKDHVGDNCFKAKKMSFSEKREMVKRKNACFYCLKIGHGAKMCRVYVKCGKCSRRHVTVMCPAESFEGDKGSPQKTVTDKGNIPKECNMASVCNDPQVYLPTLRAKLKSETTDRIVRVVVDTGSQKSYITKEVAAQVAYEPIAEQQLNHSLFGGTKSGIRKHKKYWVRLVSLDDSFACKFAAFDQDVVCVDVPLVERGEWCNELQENIHISDLGSHEQSINVLIGADIAGKFLTGQHQVLSCGLVAVETRLGWTIMGKVPGTENRRDPVITAISMFVKEENVADLWSLEVLGIKDPIHVKTQKEQEESMKQEFLKTVTINPDGRYEVELPWVENHPALSDSKTVAVRRLQSTIKKLQLDGKFEAYDGVLEQWVEEGIVEYVPKEEEEQWGHYLPHRAVIKEGSTTAVRPVFDASARERQFPSLNECPNLIELVTSILLRFRQGSIGVGSDITKAFLQISLRPKDRDFLRFLWVDKEGKTVIIRHCRVVFGVSCSPFILGAVINMHLEKIIKSIENGSDVLLDRENIVKLSRSYYVDNCVTSLNSIDHLNKFIADSRKAMELANFDLRGWEYNGDDTLKSQVTVLGIV